MKKLFVSALVFATLRLNAQDTFSIVAVDTATGEVGSAGASCINGSIIISDLHPGVGAIHTQSYWNTNNQKYASQLMDKGYSPQQIIDSLVAFDAQGDPSIRQYGIVDFGTSGTPRTAAYTGTNCFDMKFHKTGFNYAIQGNILLDSSVIDSMESHFLRATGNLADRLMFSLQGANFPGADSRCLSDGTSSLSAFLRVAKPTDGKCYWLHLNVNAAPVGKEPIDSLQYLYDTYKAGCSLLKAELYSNKDTTDILKYKGKVTFKSINNFESCIKWTISDGTVIDHSGTVNPESFSYTFAEPGIYTVKLEVWNIGCYDSTSKTIVVLQDINNPNLSVNDEIEKSIEIYPNPSKGFVNFSINNPRIKYIEIQTLDGKIIHNISVENQKEIYTWSTLYRSGIFIVKFIGSEDICVRKLIIE